MAISPETIQRVIKATPEKIVEILRKVPEAQGDILGALSVSQKQAVLSVLEGPREAQAFTPQDAAAITGMGLPSDGPPPSAVPGAPSNITFAPKGGRKFPRDLFPQNIPMDLTLFGMDPAEWTPHAMAAAFQATGPVLGSAARLGLEGSRLGLRVTEMATRGYVGELAARFGWEMGEGKEWNDAITGVLAEDPARATEYITGALIGEGATKLGRTLFGTKPGPRQKKALEFASKQQKAQPGEVIDNLMLGSGGGAPRLPVDAATGAGFPKFLRFLLVGDHATSVKVRQAHHWMNEAIRGSSEFKFVRLPSGEKYQGIPSLTDLKMAAQRTVAQKFRPQGADIGRVNTFFDFDQSAEKWFENLLRPANKKRLQALRNADPDLHALVMARKLSDRLERFMTQVEGLGPVVDGKRLHKWAADNEDVIRREYPDGTFENLWNYSNYAEVMESMVRKFGPEMNVGVDEIARASAETGVQLLAGTVALPVQTAAWSLAHSLGDSQGLWHHLFRYLPKTEKVAAQAARSAVTISSDDPETLLGVEVPEAAKKFDPFGLGPGAR